MMGLKIENPPEYLVEQIEGKPAEPQPAAGSKPASPAQKKSKSKKAKPTPLEERIEDDFPDDDIPLLTQDLIDERIKKIEVDTVQTEAEKNIDIDSKKSDSVKLLDLALEKGTLNKSDIEKEKKKVRFFKENFPGGECRSRYPSIMNSIRYFSRKYWLVPHSASSDMVLSSTRSRTRQNVS